MTRAVYCIVAYWDFGLAMQYNRFSVIVIPIIAALAFEWERQAISDLLGCIRAVRSR